MQSTTISLLTAEGAAAFTFSPALSGEQYAELSALIAASHRRENTRDAIKDWAAGAGLQLEIDGKACR